ncbi:MAG: fasciclin domain-containing protein [Candidatus Rokubacteria bacterium]|nr:fasciclin domain-containing protein [Candidatus Rokubacteria bacterium]
MRQLKGMLAVLGIGALVVAGSSGPVAAQTGDIVSVLQQKGDFKILVQALQVTGLVGAAQSSGPYTVFAPNDQAWGALGQEQINKLFADSPRLREVVAYHVVPGKMTAVDVVRMPMATTAGGQCVTLTGADGVRVGNVKAVQTDIQASNGVIHVVDAVIVPAPGGVNVQSLANRIIRATDNRLDGSAYDARAKVKAALDAYKAGKCADAEKLVKEGAALVGIKL